MRFITNHFPSKQKPDAVRTIYEPLTYLKSKEISTNSRYNKARMIRTKHILHPNKFVPQSFENTRAKEYHETLDRRIIKKSDSDTYFVVDEYTANRLDVIALRQYGNARLWWVIADANPEIRFDPYHIPRGTTLRIPSLSTLYQSGGVL